RWDSRSSKILLSVVVSHGRKPDLRNVFRRVVSKLVCVVGILAAAVAMAPATAAPSGSRSRVQLSALESGVLVQLNQIRAEHGLVPLRINAQLTAASVQHTREMTAK